MTKGSAANSGGPIMRAARRSPPQTPKSITPTTAPVYLPKREVLRRYGDVSPSWLARRLRDPSFPRPIYLAGGKMPFWRVADLESWERNKDHHPAPPVNVGPSS